MRRGIVFKLFTLTTALCVLILVTIFVGQTVFFKQYYVHQKVDKVQASLQAFAEQYQAEKGSNAATEQLEQSFYQEHNTLVTVLDHLGNLKDTDDLSIEVQINKSEVQSLNNKKITIPLYSFMNNDYVQMDDLQSEKSGLQIGNTVAVDIIQIGDEIVPYRILAYDYGTVWENNQLGKKIREHYEAYPNQAYPKVVSPKEKLNPNPEELIPTNAFYGKIVKINVPSKDASTRFMYTNHLFLERIKAFQADLIMQQIKDVYEQSAQNSTYEENDIQYKQFMMPIQSQAGEMEYIYAMASLQPVDEAIQMIQDYYVYLVVFVLVLIVLVSFYYSKRIARPLLLINDTTKKIAELDFSKQIRINSKDEIGDLSHNINELSDTLHSHIQKLQQDIQKEKQLEVTRKEFISGVSHELKTPLSVIRSCLWVLKDDVAGEKRDYYFEAMENEVKKMDHLIVDMLELSKYESGTYKMEVEVFAIDEMIEVICDKFAPEMTKKRLWLNLSLHHTEVVANPLRIEQVLVNFISNAIRYSPDGESIRLSMVDQTNTIGINIENTGTHIPEDQLDKIWDRFYRGEASRRRSSGGTGLGLAISKRILELHGLSYGVRNTEDGVLFYFNLKKSEERS
ncbi:HAMP domain-containing histidine kinase [Paenibacillus sp. N1-5-1-14]|uniref:sensor histidine kinase n=1 Tax=Paenibacillus radicibacter TaxID=2972488 RepID=UPI002159351F|nr:HAMP domain-containing sensor histidine kinase [Paenibacillus radicibacter]MCR8644296.1 HAMP domain-containing histidine kinase [Paenibacillus radicibacter]